MSYEFVIIKILPEKYLKDFLDGNIYMNADSYFTNIESDGFLRADTHEGADEAIQFKEIAIENSEGEFVPIGGAISPMIYRSGNAGGRNILCTYMFTDQPEFKFDTRNLGFGDKAVIIKDFDEFAQRVDLAVSNAGKRLLKGPVEYVNKCEYHGQMGPFRKFSEYSFQSEFRFVVLVDKVTKPEALLLTIGDIRDISLVLPSKQLTTMRVKKVK